MHPSFTRILSNFITDRTASFRISTNHPHQWRPTRNVPLIRTIQFLHQRGFPSLTNSTLIQHCIRRRHHPNYIPHIPLMLLRPCQVATQRTINTFEKQWKIQTNANEYLNTNKSFQYLETQHPSTCPRPPKTNW